METEFSLFYFSWQNSHGTPGIFFKYDVSALKVEVLESHESVIGFLTRLCGIIGGVFTCSGMWRFCQDSLWVLIISSTNPVCDDKLWALDDDLYWVICKTNYIEHLDLLKTCHLLLKWFWNFEKRWYYLKPMLRTFSSIFLVSWYESKLVH